MPGVTTARDRDAGLDDLSTSTIVVRPAVAIIGLKLRVVRR
jgi:hypothetical protein